MFKTVPSTERGPSVSNFSLITVKHLHFHLASMWLYSCLLRKITHCILLPCCPVSPGALLLLARLCSVANGGIRSSGTPAGNCVWVVSTAFSLPVTHAAFRCVGYHDAPCVLTVVTLRVLGQRWPAGDWKRQLVRCKQLLWCFWSFSLILIWGKQPNGGGLV